MKQVLQWRFPLPAPATRSRHYFSRLGLSCFTILISGIYVFDASSANAQGTTAKTISISMQPQSPISTLMYGANYVWTTTPGSQYPAWMNQLTGYAAQPSAPVSLFRYPGGWDGEYYDWPANAMNTGGPTYTAPGEPAGQFLEYVQPMAIGSVTRAASFVLQTMDVITTQTPSNIPALISQSISGYLSLLSLYQGNVRYWEIGNEWWLQCGAAANTAPLSSNTLLTRNLTRYAQLVAAAAPIIKAAYPNIKLYVTADWTTAGLTPANDEFVQLRNLVGPAAWALIDGISIHTYCGANIPASLCTSLPAQVATIKQDTGKTAIYASEWSLGSGQSSNDYGIRNANITVSAFQDMALAGITMASYWPSIGFTPDIALTTGTSLTATGLLFRTMALLYEGEAIPTHVTDVSGPAGLTVAVAAKNNVRGRNGIAVIIPTNGDGPETISVSLAGTGMTTVSTSSVMYSKNPDADDIAVLPYMVPLSTSIVHEPDGSLAAQFILNPGTFGRGSSWEIGVLELQ